MVQVKQLRFSVGFVFFFFLPFVVEGTDAQPTRVNEADAKGRAAQESSKKAADVENEAWRASINAEVKPEDPKVVAHAVNKNEDAAEEHETAAQKHKKASQAHAENNDDEAARGAHAYSKIHTKAAKQSRGLVEDYKKHLKNIDGSAE